tara:strand:- start:2267 stop:3517 length:1251 start_codon:yes stop_codon:yes gene_type:complete
MSKKEKLAFYGGQKVRVKSMPSRSAIGAKEVKAINDVIKFYRSKKEDPPYDGVFQKKFETEFTKKMNGGYATAVCSGSVACFIGIRALRLPHGSEVIVSPVTDSGSLFAILESGLTPVVVDSKINSFNTDWEEIKRGITKKTSAIFLVHCSGNPLDMRKISSEAKKLNIAIIEDCSQAPFAKVCKLKCKNYKPQNICEGKYVGKFGDVAVYSTMYRKTLQSGGSGGIVYTRNKKLHKNIIEESDRGRPKWKSNYNSRNPGDTNLSALNYNTDEISCAIGLASLQRLDLAIHKRMKFLKNFSRKIKSFESFLIHSEFYPGTSPFLLPIILKNYSDSKKEKIAKFIQAEGIDLSPRYDCVLANWRIIKNYNIKIIKSSNVKKMQSQSFNLFLNENYTSKEVNDIYKAIKKIIFYLEES